MHCQICHKYHMPGSTYFCMGDVTPCTNQCFNPAPQQPSYQYFIMPADIINRLERIEALLNTLVFGDRKSRNKKRKGK